MFDIGFWELTVIAVISLIILGPERMPTAIRTVRGWVRSIKQFSSSMQTELKEELRIHELHESLRKAEQQGMKNLSPELQESVDQLKAAAEQANRPYANSNNQQTSSTNSHDEQNSVDVKTSTPNNDDTSQEKTK
ncbi:Sec-independent protein translocase protein TatB [Thalassotalea maritima]|uniref:Sec-independent protein translocase protein TatB n=1 Tax=Thalassotalea maritima TaxID=3242416 RepID=UPI00352935DA